MTSQMGQKNFKHIVAYLYNVSGRSVIFRHQVVRFYNISKAPVLFRYNLPHVSLVSNWLILSTYCMILLFSLVNEPILLR